MEPFSKRQAKSLLETAIKGWEEQTKFYPDSINLCNGEKYNPKESVYGFAYWLIMHSGLVVETPPDEDKI